MAIGKGKFRVLRGILTGRCMLRGHLSMLRLVDSGTCRMKTLRLNTLSRRSGEDVLAIYSRMN